MADRIRLRVPSSVAALIGPAAASEDKLKGLSNVAEIAPGPAAVIFVFSLMNDSDSLVKSAAAVAFGELSEKSLLEFIKQPGQHPLILDLILRYHSHNRVVLAALLESEELSAQAREFILQLMATQPPVDCTTGNDNQVSEVEESDDSLQLDDLAEQEEESEYDAEVVEEDDLERSEEEEEEYLSKYKMCQLMGIAEKIKMALSGDKEWRSILIKDANKLVSGSVIKNPRLTDGEVLTILKAGVQNDEILRLICSNKEWIKNYLIRKALVENPRTPVPNALRYLSTLGEKDVAGYAKSKNISSVISTQAKRMLLNKKR